MGFEVSESLVTTVVPFLELHNGIGLLIVAVFMYLRSDSVLKLFGIGVGLLGFGPLTNAASSLQPVDAVQTLFAVLGGFGSLVAVIAFVVVGSSDYTRRWRLVAIGGVIVWAAFLFIMAPLLGIDSVQENTDVYGVLNTFATVWFLVGWFIAFLEAAHIVVEHSHSEPYRSILVAAMSVFAVSIVVSVVAGEVVAGENDQLHFFSSIVTSVMVLVMWIAVVVHERKEIVLEHQNVD